MPCCFIYFFDRLVNGDIRNESNFKEQNDLINIACIIGSYILTDY